MIKKKTDWSAKNFAKQLLEYIEYNIKKLQIIRINRDCRGVVPIESDVVRLVVLYILLLFLIIILLFLFPGVYFTVKECTRLLAALCPSLNAD